ncbi:acyltransferase family protein [Siccibacter colletis]|uniref:acyltransferase family protein n=1 Tax=Siccibacter colletis TaxID=1505757 RepID=UPI003CF1F96D
MRVYSIDYLRGVMALCVVSYHFAGWVGYPQDASTLLGKLGIYAVSIFFIISGCALYLAHHNDKLSWRHYKIFIIKRYFRLLPVYWLAMVLVILYWFTYGNGISRDVSTLILNATLLFGIYKPADYIVVGGWSIGNEVFYYSLFPAILMLVKSRAGQCILITICLILFSFFTFFYLSDSSSLSAQWKHYINPFNNMVYFISGVFLSYALYNFNASKHYSLCLIVLLTIIFCSFPGSGNQITIVTGFDRVALSLIVISLVALVFILKDLKNFPFLHNAFKFLGEISYSMYLLHGVMFSFFTKQLPNFGLDMKSDAMSIYVVFILLLMAASKMCYEHIEIPAINLGKKIISRL